MPSFNKVILMGNLTADPELKQTPNGVPVTSFSIAVERRFQSQNGQREVDFINIVCWRQTAEFVSKYFSKGKSILICGTLQTRSWVDNNNQKRYTTEVVADEVSFVGRKDDSSSSSPYQSAASMPSYSTPKSEGSFEEISADDDLPF